MTRILRIDCSPRGAVSHSRQLADEMMEELAHDGADIVTRDLVRDPPPIVDAAFAAAMMVHQTAESARAIAALQPSERLIGELEACDLLVLSTPMHNFTVPALLKAWLAVKPQEVVLGQAEATDGWLLGEASMWPMPVVAVQPR